MANNYTKHIFFDDEETALRFKALYGCVIDVDANSYWVRNYYGPNAKDKIHVYYHGTSEEFEEIVKAIKLKKKRWGGHLCYYFE